MLDIASHIEQTCLRPEATQADIDRLIHEAVDHGFHGVCVPPFWVKHTRREIPAGGPRVITVVGFPLGYQLTETKLDEISRLIDHGADELDMVWNLSAFKSTMPWTKIDVARCTQLAHSSQRLMKVILETDKLTEEELNEGCLLCSEAGADFVKTSTGFSGQGATVEVVQRMRQILPANVGIKASGGIRSSEAAIALIKAGADRIGTSSGVQIVRELNQRNS